MLLKKQSMILLNHVDMALLEAVQNICLPALRLQKDYSKGSVEHVVLLAMTEEVGFVCAGLLRWIKN